MSDAKKITAILPRELLATAMRASGAGLTETLRIALLDYSHHAASRRLLAARGKVRFESDWRDLRDKDEE